MVTKKSLLVAGVVSTIGLAASTAGMVSAATSSSASPHDGLVGKIAERFNLDKTEVSKVFEEDRAAHEAEHKVKMEERLSQAVTDGKLTEDQKTKILAKMEELKNNRPTREEMQSKTPEQMHTEMEQKRTEIEQWAKDNDIPEEFVPFKFKIRGSFGPDGPTDGPKGPGMGMHMHAEQL